MCTIVALFGVHPSFPLVVAANRDEFYARGATPPEVVSGSPRIVAGRDLQSGGTWMGATARGFFVGVTNQRSYSGAVQGLRSRGEVALAALRAGTIDGTGALVHALDPSEYNAFNLIYGDARGLRVAYVRREPPGVEVVSLPQGVHVLSNDRMGSTEFPKAGRAMSLVAPHIDAPWDALAPALHDALADHALPPLDAVPDPPPGSWVDRPLVQQLQAICIHTPAYGTRSSTILALEDGRVAHYLFANGPPCTHAHEPVTVLEG